MTTTSLLHTALQNLHVSQQGSNSHPSSPRPRRTRLDPDSDSSAPTTPGEDDEEMVGVGMGTAPATPLPGQKGLVLGQRVPSALAGKISDPLRTLPTSIAVQIFLQLDIRSLGRCERVCKRWQKSSTLNYVWFLQNRALLLPAFAEPQKRDGETRRIDAETEFFDPYEKKRRLKDLPAPRLPTSKTLQWSKGESKKAWKKVFHTTLKRTDPNAEEEEDPRRVDIYSLHSSGISTPTGHGYKGMGSGGANATKWAAAELDSSLSKTEYKVASRQAYKALGGRKSRAKNRKTAASEGVEAADDGRYDAPF